MTQVASQVNGVDKTPETYNIMYLPTDILTNIIRMDIRHGVDMRLLNVGLRNLVDEVSSIKYVMKNVATGEVFASRLFERLSEFFERVGKESQSYELKVVRYGLNRVVGETFNFEFDRITFVNFNEHIERKFELVTKKIKYVNCSKSPAIFPKVKFQTELICDGCTIDNLTFFQGMNFKVVYTGSGTTHISHPLVSFYNCLINIRSFGCPIEFGQFEFIGCEVVGNSLVSLIKSRTMHHLEITKTKFPKILPEMTLQHLKLNGGGVLVDHYVDVLLLGIDIANINFFLGSMDVNLALQRELAKSDDVDDQKMIELLKFVELNWIDFEDEDFGVEPIYEIDEEFVVDNDEIN